MRRCVIVIAFLVGGLSCLSVRVRAQIPNTKSPDPISPNIASMARYGNIPVGLYTGQPNVSFPLYEIDNGYVKVPVTLSYNYNGFKIEDYPGWVGMGWTVSGTGVITRQQRGLPDEAPAGYTGTGRYAEKIIEFLSLNLNGDQLQLNWEEADNDNLAGNEWDDEYDLLNAFANGMADSEPDMFVFSCPGHSGKFFFDVTQCGKTTKVATVMPHQNLTVKGYFDYGVVTNGIHGEITKFEITDERGVVYLFELKERSKKAREYDIDDRDPDQDFQNSWLLTSIEDPFGKTINYTYKPARLQALPSTVVDRMVFPEQFVSKPVFTPANTWESVLSKIDYRNSTNDLLGEVVFIESSETRLDWNHATWPEYADATPEQLQYIEQPRSLSKITIKANNSTIKDILFNYSYFGDNARLRLDSFQDVNGDDSTPPTKFEYLPGIFPKIGDRRAIFSQDHWGYYTGGNNTTLIPPVTLNTRGMVISGDPLDPYDDHFSEVDQWIDIPGNNRAPKPEYSSAGLLSKIEYPTGGTTTFEYEPNEYFLEGNEIDIPSATCSEVNIRQSALSLKFVVPPTGNKIEEDQSLIHITKPVCARVSYKISAGNCIDNSATVRLTNAQTGGELSNHSQMITANGAVDSGSGYDSDDIFTLQPGDYKTSVYIECVYCPDPLTFKKVEASLTLYVSADPESLPLNAIAGGMRVRKITDCALMEVSGCSSKFFRYDDVENVGLSSGDLVGIPSYQYPTSVIQTIGVGGENGRTFTSVPGTVLSGSSLVPVTVTMGNTVGYKYVTVLEAEDGSKGRSVHKFTSPDGFNDGPSATPPFAIRTSNHPFPPVIDNDYKRGILLRQEDFANGTSNSIKIAEVTPQFPSHSSVKAMKVGPRFVDPVGLPAEISLTIGPHKLSGYEFVPYNIQSGWQRTESQEETIKDQFSNQTSTTITEFTYGTQKHLLPIEKAFIDSKNQIIKTTYKYRDDAQSLTELTLQQRSDIQSSPDETILIQQKIYKGDVLRETQLNLYKGLLLQTSLVSYGDGPLNEEVSFTKYDREGRPLSFRLKSGEVHSYQYGYNASYPILHAINASSDDVFVEDFESSLNSTFYGELAHTGKKAMAVSSYTFPSTYNPNPAKTKMSYWYWDGGQWKFSGELNYSSSFTAQGTRIDDVRAYPVGSILQTFTFIPGVGMTSRTDHNGRIQYFKFDGLGRLKSVQDEKKNMINYYDYFYKNEN